MRLLHHLPGDVRVTRAGASIECVRPGCNMGLTIDPERTPQVHGSAVDYCCAAPAPDVPCQSPGGKMTATIAGTGNPVETRKLNTALRHAWGLDT